MKQEKVFLECLEASEPNPQNTDLSEIQVFQENQKKLFPGPYWYTLMQTATKYSSSFLGPSLTSSLFFIAVIFQGLHWGSLQIYPSNVVARGRGSSLYYFHVEPCWKKYKPKVNSDTKRLCSWILPRRRRERGYLKHARILYQRPHSIAELRKEPQAFQLSVHCLNLLYQFCEHLSYTGVAHLPLPIYPGCKLHHRSIYIKA